MAADAFLLGCKIKLGGRTKGREGEKGEILWTISVEPGSRFQSLQDLPVTC